MLHSAPGQGVSRPPHTASRDCRTAHPLPVRSRVRLHRKAGSRRKRKKWVKGLQNDAAKKPKKPCIAVSDPTRSAASRAVMAGWAGEGGGRFGERREYEAPTLPSTPRQHGMARHYKSQARNSTLQQHSAVRHHTCQPSNGTPLQQSTEKPQHCTARRQKHQTLARSKPGRPTR